MPIPKVYKEYFEKKHIIIDDNQIILLEKLYIFHDKIKKYKKDRTNKFIKLLKRPKISKGIYLYGDVGTGKSMIMEAFFRNATLTKKRKISFHNFMIEVHKNLHSLRTEKKDNQVGDFLEEIAYSLAKKYRLLYIDELEIQDITDAMIVGKLFRELFKHNMMIIITSNRIPDDLYLNGLQRDSFLEFIDLIKCNLKIFELNSGIDYRLTKLSSFKKTFFTPLGKAAEDFITESFASLSNNHQSYPLTLEINQRQFLCPKTYKDIALFEFKELFSAALGTLDYASLCKNFNIIIIANIPQLTASERNEARRFINFIDILYENKTNLICSCEVEANLIYNSGDGNFEFERTTSRLIEMQSEEYIKRRLC